MFISFVVFVFGFELFVLRNFVQKEVCVCMCVCMYPYCEYVETCQRICLFVSCLVVCEHFRLLYQIKSDRGSKQERKESKK